MSSATAAADPFFIAHSHACGSDCGQLQGRRDAPVIPLVIVKEVIQCPSALFAPLSRDQKKKKKPFFLILFISFSPNRQQSNSLRRRRRSRNQMFVSIKISEWAGQWHGCQTIKNINRKIANLDEGE